MESLLNKMVAFIQETGKMEKEMDLAQLKRKNIKSSMDCGKMAHKPETLMRKWFTKYNKVKQTTEHFS